MSQSGATKVPLLSTVTTVCNSRFLASQDSRAPLALANSLLDIPNTKRSGQYLSWSQHHPRQFVARVIVRQLRAAPSKARAPRCKSVGNHRPTAGWTTVPASTRATSRCQRPVMCISRKNEVLQLADRVFRGSGRRRRSERPQPSDAHPLRLLRASRESDNLRVASWKVLATRAVGRRKCAR